MTEDDDRLANRLAWITGLRLLFLSLLLAATAFFYLRGALGRYPESQAIVFWSIGAAYALAAAYAIVLRQGRHLKRLAEAQIILDQMTWTAIVYVSGGATSGATSFYGLTCLVAAILVGLRGAAMAGIAGITFFLLMCASFALGWTQPPSDQADANYIVTWNGMAYPVLVNVLGIVVVTLLAGYLAERLRRAGGALVEANERALAAERLALLGRIAAGLAHEIRNPLGSISGSIELLREAPGLSSDDRRLCDIIHREAARLNHLVSDMMDLSKPRPPQPRNVDVGRLAREVVALASRSDRSGSGDVAVRYEGSSDAVWAHCDGAQMRQVLWNLVRNGVQASPAGSTVTISVAEVDGHVRMTVTDQGPGIAEEAIGKIFDAFYTTRQQGSGIGLAVVRRIMEDHAKYGARITVTNVLEKGAPASTADARPGARFEVSLARAEPGTTSDSILPDPYVMVPENRGSHGSRGP
ncbi:Two-component sensor PilS [Labilithrix luteola]|uniref:histidine kinase n=1 Tax=Labilithrix luteola TaxID=1391654 RepID=A0A0K1Q1A2_9BACT|nr:ATP-binding protein [Labilithrix luteola]AKU99565.1 Two-component sensor PilS [Labilithrix luteola]